MVLLPTPRADSRRPRPFRATERLVGIPQPPPSPEPPMPTAITDWSGAMMTSLAAALAMFLSAIPKIIGFAIILVVGWLLSALVEKGIAALLRAVRFNDLAQRSGFADFVSKMNVGTD